MNQRSARNCPKRVRSLKKFLISLGQLRPFLRVSNTGTQDPWPDKGRTKKKRLVWDAGSATNPTATLIKLSRKVGVERVVVNERGAGEKARSRTEDGPVRQEGDVGSDSGSDVYSGSTL